jgi:hypothetical protein
MAPQPALTSGTINFYGLRRKPNFLVYLQHQGGFLFFCDRSHSPFLSSDLTVAHGTALEFLPVLNKDLYRLISQTSPVGGFAPAKIGMHTPTEKMNSKKPDEE